jgi:DNA repair ATPase RecN
MGDLLNKITKRFMVTEGVGPTFQTWIQSLSDNLNSLNPKSLSDERRIDLMKHQLRELKKVTRRMNQQIIQLEEQVTLLQEHNNE